MDFTLVHAHWFLLSLSLAFLPRLTTLCMAFFGSLMLPLDNAYRVLWIVGWFLTPRLLIAILALAYFNANPVLVVLAWIIAFSGESSEKRVVLKRSNSNG